jgi:hypothetical protein
MARLLPISEHIKLIGYVSGATNDMDRQYDAESFDANEYVDFIVSLITKSSHSRSTVPLIVMIK